MNIVFYAYKKNKNQILDPPPVHEAAKKLAHNRFSGMQRVVMRHVCSQKRVNVEITPVSHWKRRESCVENWRCFIFWIPHGQLLINRRKNGGRIKKKTVISSTRRAVTPWHRRSVENHFFFFRKRFRPVHGWFSSIRNRSRPRTRKSRPESPRGFLPCAFENAAANRPTTLPNKDRLIAPVRHGTTRHDGISFWS